MSQGFEKDERNRTTNIPGRVFLKNFFRVQGPVVTLKGLWFYYYSKLKLRGLSLDPTKDHVVRVNGYDMLIIPTDKGISAELAMFNSHEPLSTKVLLSELKKGMVCLDIGSNIGYYALLESRIVGKQGKVICLEPSALNFHYLKRNLEMQGQSEINLYNIAAGDVDGDVEFLTDVQSNLCRVVKGPMKGQHYGDEKNRITKIPMKRIDSLIRDAPLDKLDFVRMDPEGYESNIYQGMKSTIRKYRPMLFIEFHRMYLGIEGTRNLLVDLRDNGGYESRYYIRRWMDQPMIANTKYIQNIPISELLKKLDEDTLPGVFSVLLVNRG